MLHGRLHHSWSRCERHSYGNGGPLISRTGHTTPKKRDSESQMQSNAADVDRYLLEAPEKRRACLETIRAACIEELGGFDESMAYGMPSYSRDDEVEVAFASQKQYISLYILRTDVLNSHRARLPGLNVGKGCIRFRNPAQVDLSVVRSMLSATATSRGKVC